MNTNKKKLLVLAMTLSMVAILAIGGTLAYFTAESSANNQFWFGGVGIIVDEAVVDHITEDNQNFWVADQEDMSRENRVDNNTYENIYPGADLPKDPIVRNISSLDAYVRLTVTYNPAAIGFMVGSEGLEDNSTRAQFEHVIDGIGEGWYFLKEELELVDWEAREFSNSITYYYEPELTGYDANWDDLDDLSELSSTTPLFTNIHVPESLETMYETYGFEMNFHAEAIQSDAFDGDVLEAWEEFDGVSYKAE